MLWLLLVTLALVKLTAASLMLWLPLRTDSAVLAVDDPPRLGDAEDDEDGGSKVSPDGSSGSRACRPHHPHRPWPSPRPRRGPHGSPAPESPERVRVGSSRRIAAKPR
jgi:hypothetical protein